MFREAVLGNSGVGERVVAAVSVLDQLVKAGKLKREIEPTVIYVGRK